jgi:hypothetical protein
MIRVIAMMISTKLWFCGLVDNWLIKKDATPQEVRLENFLIL